VLPGFVSRDVNVSRLNAMPGRPRELLPELFESLHLKQVSKARVAVAIDHKREATAGAASRQVTARGCRNDAPQGISTLLMTMITPLD
jgi:hypothetical protein